MDFGIADMSFGLCDMNRLCAPLAPVKIITDNNVETVVFGNTDIPHPFNLSKTYAT